MEFVRRGDVVRPGGGDGAGHHEPGEQGRGLVTLSWQPTLGTTSYVLQVGSGPGLSDVFVGSFGAVTSLTFGNGVLPPGIDYLRVVAAGPCGLGSPSGDVVLTLP